MDDLRVTPANADEWNRLFDDIMAGEQEMRPVFQPIVDLLTGHVVGHEALMRFPGLEPPVGKVFDVAADLGRAVDLETAVARCVLRNVGRPPDGTYLSVNAGPEAITERRIAPLMKDHASCDQLMVELTERTAVRSYEPLVAELAQMRRVGIRVAIDDVGAGFASMRHVHRVKPEVVKLDCSLVRHVDIDETLMTLALCLRSFAAHVGASMVAECVETESELEALLMCGIRYGQGYLLGKPEPDFGDPVIPVGRRNRKWFRTKGER